MTKITLLKEARPVYRRCCTDLELHAYVDGELNSQEQAFVLESVSSSADIRTQLDDLKELKELIRMSYQQI